MTGRYQALLCKLKEDKNFDVALCGERRGEKLWVQVLIGLLLFLNY